MYNPRSSFGDIPTNQLEISRSPFDLIRNRKKQLFTKEQQTLEEQRLSLIRELEEQPTTIGDSTDESTYITYVTNIIENLPIGFGHKDSLIRKLEEYKLGFPEYCGCFFNDEIDEDEPDDIWLSSLFPLVQTIRDQLQSNDTIKGILQFGRTRKSRGTRGTRKKRSTRTRK